ncbi:MAG: hypothetical protein SFU85_11870 [Candidatus Methylacidiphilales bacterium]|nr:hypothetical protein [Candidatus Methylacidiphilales bacterium]
MIRLSAFCPRENPAQSAAFGQAVEAFKNKDYQRAWGILDGPLKATEDAEILNLCGAVLTEWGRRNEARPYFLRAVMLRPAHFWSRYNLAELDLLDGKTAAAREGFRSLKSGILGQDDLLDLKIILTFLAEKKPDDAAKVLQAMPDPPVSAAGCLAHAVVAFRFGEMGSFRRWRQSAETQFPTQMGEFLRRTLMDSGFGSDFWQTPEF